MKIIFTLLYEAYAITNAWSSENCKCRIEIPRACHVPTGWIAPSYTNHYLIPKQVESKVQVVSYIKYIIPYPAVYIEHFLVIASYLAYF